MRMPYIEAWRGAAAFCVVIIHTTPFLKNLEPIGFWYYLGQVIQQSTSFAVPFFFITAGYFFSSGINSNGLKKQFIRYESRILKLLVIWVVIDGVFWADWLKAILDHGSLKPLLWNIYAVPSFAMKRPDLFFLRGTAVPLWFLVSLIGGMFLLTVLIRIGCNKNIILFIGCVAYLFNLCSSSYRNTLVGFGSYIPLEQRGIAIAIFFLAIGHFVARTKLTINGPVVLVVSVAAMFIEGIVLSLSNGNSFIEHPYLFSTAIVSFAVFLTAIQNPMVCDGSFMHKVGLMSLGIYLVHTPVMGALNYFRSSFKSPCFELLFPIAVFFLSIIIVFNLRKIRYLRSIVT